MKQLGSFLLLAMIVVSSSADEANTVNLGTGLSAEQTEALIKRAIEESAAEDDDCADNNLLTCIGISRSTCESFRSEILKECTLPQARDLLSNSAERGPGEIEFNHAKCTLLLAEREHKIDPAQYLKCLPDGTYKNSAAITEWLDNR